MEPETREDWQEAVDAAKASLAVHAARLYGLITGGPRVNVERCLETLARGAELGVVPSETAIERFVFEAVRS